MECTFELRGFSFESPIWIAAGLVKTLENAHSVLNLGAAAFVTGSFTTGHRKGYGSGSWYVDKFFTLNALGLPNPGIWGAKLIEMGVLCHEAKMPFIVSVAGGSPERYKDLAWHAFESGADLVELNLGCPNVWSGGRQEEIASYNPLLIREILRNVCDLKNIEGLGVKLSPLANPRLVENVAGVLNEFSSYIDYVASCNSYPNGFSWNEGEAAIKLPGGLGLAGVAGPALRPMSLGQVVQLRRLLFESIQILGVGGICSVEDVEDYLRAGASMVQVASLLAYSPGDFETLIVDWKRSVS